MLPTRLLPLLALAFLFAINDTRAEPAPDFPLKGQWLSNDVNGPAGPSRTFLEFLPGNLVEMRVQYLAPEGEIKAKGTYTLTGRTLRTEILNTGEPVEIIVVDPDTIRLSGSEYLKDFIFHRQPAQAQAP